MVNCDKTTVRDALLVGEKSQCDIPPHIAENRNSQADFRKLTPAGQDRVRQGEPLNRVATYPESLGDFFQQL